MILCNNPQINMVYQTYLRLCIVHYNYGMEEDIKQILRNEKG